eukprot:SAG31_NODE_41512_length_275_cov_1.948864_1_plen_28_part_01
MLRHGIPNDAVKTAAISDSFVLRLPGAA